MTDGGNYSGATTDRLAVTDPANGNQYRVTVSEQGNPNPVSGEIFEVEVIPTPAAPTSVTISGGGTICRGTPVQLTSSVSGGTNLFYEWQSDPGGTGTFTTIPDANLSTYVPPVNETGLVHYRLRVSSGSACIPERLSNTIVNTVSGISSTTPDERCGDGQVNLEATATAGTISWYSVDEAGSDVATGPTYSPTLSGPATYFVSTSACPTALRVPVTATISPATAGGTVEGSAEVTPGTNSTTLTLINHTGNVIGWQSSTDGFASNIVDIPNTSGELTVTNITETTSFRALLQSGSCASASSTPATITVSTLPVHFSSVKAARENEGIRVRWVAYNQQNTVQFVIERSANGNDFVKVAAISAENTGGDVKYQWLDGNPVKGRNYYRIKEVYATGTHTYSSVVSALFQNSEPGIAAYPNPVTDRNINLDFRNMNAGKYHVSVTNMYGQAVHRQLVNHAGGYHTYPVRIPANISNGVYRLVISGVDKGKTKSLSVIIE